MNLVETLKAKRMALVAKQEELKEMLRKEGDAFFTEGLKAFWDAYPQVQTIHWTQYTPYFNDGEPCEFGVGDVYFTTTPAKDLEGSYGEEDDGDLRERIWDWDAKPPRRLPNPIFTEQMASDFAAVREMIHTLDLLAIFGDHVWVKVSRDGAVAEEYEHD